jgi:hypothetical protein
VRLGAQVVQPRLWECFATYLFELESRTPSRKKTKAVPTAPVLAGKDAAASTSRSPQLKKSTASAVEEQGRLGTHIAYSTALIYFNNALQQAVSRCAVF